MSGQSQVLEKVHYDLLSVGRSHCAWGPFFVLSDVQMKKSVERELCSKKGQVQSRQ